MSRSGQGGRAELEEGKREEEEENMKLWWTSKVEVTSLADESGLRAGR